MTGVRAAASVAACVALTGCVGMTPPTSVHQPMTARPEARVPPAVGNGAIYQTSLARPLFEDRRARNVGDTLIIQIVEKNQASKKSNTSAERSHSTQAAVPVISGIPGKGFQGLSVAGTHDTTFEGKGDSDARNDFTGSLAVTVIETLPNGNLLVSGEKQVAINQGEEFIRFSGVVNPNNITAANTVQSTQVADARIEYRANGPLDQAQVMGWLARFFLVVLPF